MSTKIAHRGHPCEHKEDFVLAKKLCKHCGSGRLRRLNRRGWLQHNLLPLMGFFPWECVICRSRVFYRDDGHRIHAEAGLHGHVS